MELISVRERPQYAAAAIAFLHTPAAMASMTVSMKTASDAAKAAPDSASPLPVVMLLHADQAAGSAGLAPNDFISRMDLWPWICALYGRLHLKCCPFQMEKHARSAT